MATNSTKTIKRLLGLILSILGIYGVIFAMYYFGDESTTCITDSICLSSKESIIQLTLLQGTFLVFLMVVIMATFRFCIWLLDRGWMMPVGGAVIFILGIVGIFCFNEFVAAEERTDFIHILIIAILSIIFGGIMLFVGLKRKR